MVSTGSCCGTLRPLARGLVLGGVAVVAVESLQAAELQLPSEPVLALLGGGTLLLGALEVRSRTRSPTPEPSADADAREPRVGSESDVDHGIAVGEHYRATAPTREDGVYRVVGAGDPIALLRVTDADGRRRHTGELLRVSPSAVANEFEADDDPDAGFSPVRSVQNQLTGLYWSVRKFF